MRGEWIAFLSDREDGKDDKNKAKTAVWLLPASRPGEPTALKLSVDVSDLDWTPDGLVVAARVYVDGDDAGMAATAARDEEIEKRGGGLDAHLFKRLPVREWDRWLDAKFAHPFLQRVERRDGSYACVGDPVDGLHRIPTSCPERRLRGQGRLGRARPGRLLVPPAARRGRGAGRRTGTSTRAAASKARRPPA